MKILIFLGSIFSMFCVSALGAGTIDAASMKFKVYKFAVSKSMECTSPITIFSSDSGVEKNMLSKPTFGSGELAAGIYPCVIIEISKIIKDSPASTSGACIANIEQSDLICNDEQTSKLVDGTAVDCSGGILNDQHVALYITTLSAGNSGNRSLLPPSSASDTASGIKLTAPFTVGDDTSGTLTVSYKNFFSSDGLSCGSNAPTFSFK